MSACLSCWCVRILREWKPWLQFVWVKCAGEVLGHRRCRRLWHTHHAARSWSKESDPNTFHSGSVRYWTLVAKVKSYTREQLQFLFERRFDFPQILLLWMLDISNNWETFAWIWTLSRISLMISLTLATSRWLVSWEQEALPFDKVALEEQYQRAHSCVLFGLVRLPHNEDKGYIMAMTTLALII